jgi:hypothetical protein
MGLAAIGPEMNHLTLVRGVLHMRRWLVVLTLPAAGCAVQSPPAPPAPAAAYVRGSADETWQRALDFLTAQRIPVQPDRPSGIITARAVDLSLQQLRDWANCGGAGGRTVQSMNDNEMRAKNIQAKADFTVTVRPSGDSTMVTPVLGIAATWTNPMLKQQAAKFECVSNGTLESNLVATIRGQ